MLGRSIVPHADVPVIVLALEVAVQESVRVDLIVVVVVGADCCRALGWHYGGPHALLFTGVPVYGAEEGMFLDLLNSTGTTVTKSLFWQFMRQSL